LTHPGAEGEHGGGPRERQPAAAREIAELYQIDESLAAPAPKGIGLFEDLLTSGAHFKAAQEVLERRFPGVLVIGVFLARRVRDRGGGESDGRRRLARLDAAAAAGPAFLQLVADASAPAREELRD
jgi:hypothetical protein